MIDEFSRAPIYKLFRYIYCSKSFTSTPFINPEKEGREEARTANLPPLPPFPRLPLAGVRKKKERGKRRKGVVRCDILSPFPLFIYPLAVREKRKGWEMIEMWSFPLFHHFHSSHITTGKKRWRAWGLTNREGKGRCYSSYTLPLQHPPFPPLPSLPLNSKVGAELINHAPETNGFLSLLK